METGYFQIQGLIKDRSNYDRVIKLALDVQLKKVSYQLIIITEVLAMKIYCGMYLLTVAVRIVQNKPGARLVWYIEYVPPSENSAAE